MIVGDRVKVDESDEMQGRSLNGRYGHVQKLIGIGGFDIQELALQLAPIVQMQTALVLFNDFDATIPVKNLKVV